MVLKPDGIVTNSFGSRMCCHIVALGVCYDVFIYVLMPRSIVGSFCMLKGSLHLGIHMSI